MHAMSCYFKQSFKYTLGLKGHLMINFQTTCVKKQFGGGKGGILGEGILFSPTLILFDFLICTNLNHPIFIYNFFCI